MRTLSRTAVVLALALGGLVIQGDATAGSRANQVAALTTTESKGATTLTIRGSETPTFTVYKLERPQRLVIDVSGAELDPTLVSGGDDKASWNINTWAVSQVVASARRDRKNQLVRIVVSLARSSSYRVKAVGKNLVVRVKARELPPHSGVANSNTNANLAQARREAAAAAAATRLATERARQAEARAAAASAKATTMKADAVQQRKAEVAKRKATEARLAVALAQIDAAKKRAANAEQEMAAAKKSAVVAKRNADARASKATREARKAKALAQKETAAAQKRLAAAQRRIASAESRASRAKALMGKAEAARSEAKEMATLAKQREKRAASALALAERRRADADKAAREAQRAKTEANRAKVSGSSESARLSKAAEEAAAAAEKRREAAEKSARIAEARKSEAEKAERASVARSRSTRVALAAAERQRKAAESARVAAEKARTKAEKDNRALLSKITQANQRAKEAASRADNFVKAAKTARGQAQEARASRLTEERALENAARARAKAEREKQRAELASVELQSSIAAHKRALAAHADKTAAAIRAASRAKSASGTNRAARDRELKRRNAELASAEKDLSKRKRALAVNEATVRKLGKARDKASAELATLKAEAAKAKDARMREEKLAARYERKRKGADASLRQAESRLADAQRDRRRAAKLVRAAEADRAAASATRTQAESELAAAVKERRKAKQERAALRLKEERIATAREAELKANARKLKASRAKKSSKKKARSARVNDVKFVDKGSAARVVVGLSAPAKPKVIKNRGKVAVLEIEGVAMAKELERTLDTTAFGGPIKAVSSYRDPKRPNTVRIVVDLFAPAKGVLKKVGNTYYWDFPNNQKRTARARTRPSVPAVRGASASASITQQTVSQLRPNRRRTYRGRRIDLNFKDADIHNLLRILATVGGVNIVVPQSVTGTVTVRLKSVPWDQAMEVILSSQGLWYRRDGSLIRVAKRDTLLKEDEDDAKRRSELVKSEAPEPEIFTLNYADAKSIKVQLGGLVSPKGRIEINDRTNSLIINDIAAHRRRIIDLATRLDTQTPQIQIEARVVEARTTFVREFGVQWGGNAAATPQGGNPTGLVFPNSVALGGAADDGQTPSTGVAATPTDFAVNLPAAIGTGSGGGLGLALGSVGGNFNVNLRLSALEDTGSARIISAPKVTVSNNVQAKIKSGVSIPISVVSANGTQTQFVPADLSLDVTPKVSQRDCSVSLVINVTKNEADFANTGARGDPSILTKEASTTILVADGETAVIGGIYTRNTGLNYSKVPFFADIPVIGYFFKNRRENDERAETLIFVTPKITNRAFLRCE